MRPRPGTSMSRHELFGHPSPVLTCPVCIAHVAGAIVYRKARKP